MCFQCGLCPRTDEIISSLLFVTSGRLLIGTVMGNIYMSSLFSCMTTSLDCIMNRVIFYCDMAMTPIIQILSCSDVSSRTMKLTYSSTGF